MAAAIIAANMPNLEDERSTSHPFQNRTDQQAGWSSHDDSAPHIPHHPLVTRFQRFIAEQQETNRQLRLSTDPAHIILQTLDFETTQTHNDQETTRRAHDFWSPIKLAWQVVAFDRFDPSDRESANHDLWTRYRGGSLKPEISLTRYQAGILDAMSDAAGIRRTHGQTTIQVQEHMRTVSKEHQQSHDATMLDFLSGGAISRLRTIRGRKR